MEVQWMQKISKKNRSNADNTFCVCVADAESKIARLAGIDLLNEAIDSCKLGAWGNKFKLSHKEKAMLLWPIQLVN